nr:nucleolar protein 14 [Kwoniella mangroviensis CBS 8507]OCF66060.1 nucleolar protein 14 [Kwoniella mangroviensis CBS 8507]
MAPSQLSQLKSALNSAGLNKKNFSKKDKKAYKKGGARETDRAKKLDKLEEIRKSLNKFDERETKVKHDVGGRNLKGVTGRPSASKQAGLEQRKKSLLPEHQLRDHTGTFRDRRFGENDPTLSLEDRMLERYTRERQRGQGKKGLFNLEDEEDGLDGFDEGFALGGLTHGGRSVMDLPGDDFEAQGFGERDEEDEDKGRVDRRTVNKVHFGGFDGEAEEEEEPEKKKSKAEVMSEIIAKSKEYKYERQQQKEADDELRDELDEDLDDLRALLQDSAPARPAASNFASTSRQPTAAPAVAAVPEEEVDYDQVVRSLAFDARAKPKDRTKTEEELALEEKENLEKAEAKRLRRMRGESVSDDEDGDGSRKKRKTSDRKPDADDLGDDYIEDDTLLGPGITREEIETMGLQSDEEDDDGEEDEEDGDGDEDEEGSEDEEEGDEEDEEMDEDDSEVYSDMEDLDDEDVPELIEADEEDFEAVVKKSKGKKVAKPEKTKEIPFTFPCPSSIEEFEDILEGLEDSALPTVIQRIRALHHPSLAAGNKEKLQDFLGVLIDYLLILSSRPTPPFILISQLTPHIIALVKLNALTAAGHSIDKIKLMQKNLTRGLAKGASQKGSKTFPGCPELVLLRLIGSIWSTSDFSHPVVAPAVLLIGQYLAQGRIRSTSDIASGLFLCSILAQYEVLSNRVLPEAVNFVASSILAILPRRKGFEVNKTYPDSKANDVDLYVDPSAAAAPQQPVNLSQAINSAQSELSHEQAEQTKVNLLVVAFKLSQTFATMYASSEAFIELIQPLAKVLEGCRVAKLSQEVKTLHAAAYTSLSRSLTHARASRRPLTLQAHKPIPIASHAPKFEENFAPGKHYDPDVERNASAKLKALYKKERKGAIRELRKDNRFLAGEKAREQAEKDRDYNSRMKKVEGSINVERAEEKAMQREKQKEKRRAGRG